MRNQTVGVVCQSCGSGVRSYGEREHCMNCDGSRASALRVLDKGAGADSRAIR
jgi:uncharacterized OB-fold protein